MLKTFPVDCFFECYIFQNVHSSTLICYSIWARVWSSLSLQMYFYILFSRDYFTAFVIYCMAPGCGASSHVWQLQPWSLTSSRVVEIKVSCGDEFRGDMAVIAERYNEAGLLCSTSHELYPWLWICCVFCSLGLFSFPITPRVRDYFREGLNFGVLQLLVNRTHYIDTRVHSHMTILPFPH